MAIGERPEDLETLRKAFGEIEGAYGKVFPSIQGQLTGSLPAQKKAKGGMIKSSASKRADGIAQRGKTRGRMI
jgi:hypothetical protein